MRSVAVRLPDMKDAVILRLTESQWTEFWLIYYEHENDEKISQFIKKVSA